MGGLSPQSADWSKHNAVLRDLIEKEWPVLYHNEDESSLLTYYLGQYLVPALSGKVICFLCGFFPLQVWRAISVSTLK